ncbi:MAG TPA: tetratricopeptide repeat protein [Xanthobacteraceae bacterium]|nr:tetratricopeptide repeat protein [Xanthobacteraceae bacterium]
MSDIFTEVDEEIRREQLRKLWDRYGGLAVAAAIVLVLAIGGWRGWQWWETKKAAEAGSAYDAAAALVEQGKLSEAEAAFGKVASEGTAGYRVLARLRDAALLGERDRAAAVAAYDAIAKDASVDPLLQELASLRAALLLVDSAPLAEITQRLEPMAAAGKTFRHTARELLAVAAVRASDNAAAKRWIDTALSDAETPQGIRARLDVLATLTEGPKG